MKLFELFGEIKIDDDGAIKSLDEMSDKSLNLSKNFSNLAKGIGKGAIAITGAITAGAGAMLGMAKNSAEATDRIDKMSQKLGLSRKGFQELDFIASQSGTSVENLSSGMKTLSTRMQEAAEGTGIGAEAFEKLGISVFDANGEMKDQEQLLKESISAFQGMEEGATKAALASDLFSRSGQELLPLLNAQEGSMEAMAKQAEELGLIIEDDAVDAGVVFTDTMDQLERAFKTAIATVGVEFMPIIQGMAKFIIDNMPKIQKFVKIAFDVIEKSVKIGINVFSEIWKFIKDNVVPIIQDLVKESKTKMIDFSRIIKTSIDLAVKILKGMWDFFRDNIIPIIKELYELGADLFPSFKKLVTVAFDGVVKVGTKLWDFFKKYILPVIEELLDVAEDVIPKLVPIFKFAFDAIEAVIDSAVAVIDGVVDSIEFMVDKIKDAIDWIKKFAKTDVEDKQVPTVGGSMSFGGFRANGGPVSANDAYIVGEKGPELFVPNTSGTIIPNKSNGNLSINISKMEVREEADIKKVARELFNLQKRNARGLAIE